MYSGYDSRTQDLALSNRPLLSYVGIIGDMVRSRQSPETRHQAQIALENALVHINNKYERAIASKFLITIGDEFQGLLIMPSTIPDILWDLEELFTYRKLRVGIGLGELYTSINDYALGTDGPVWYLARNAIETAKSDKKLGGVFVGFKEEETTLNALAHLLHYQRSQFTQKQREIISLLRQGYQQVEVAKRLEISKQNTNRQVAATGWTTYQEGELAWRKLLAEFDSTMDSDNCIH